MGSNDSPSLHISRSIEPQSHRLLLLRIRIRIWSMSLSPLSAPILRRERFSQIRALEMI